MKKVLLSIFAFILLFSLASCGDDGKTIVVGATPSPHAEILNSEPTELPAIFSLKTHLIIGGILCLLYLVPGVIYFIIYFKKKKENANWYEKKYAEWSEKMNTEGKRILEEATSLLS